jgi:ferredoxin-thioredoxin reductase catalytic chain
MNKTEITDEEIEKLYIKLEDEAESSGYHLNPDIDFTKKLVRGLLINQGRYGYQACPCRLAAGDKKKDLDIICPCNYRDPDLDDYGTCYCGLYVDKEILSGKKKLGPVPERRFMGQKNLQQKEIKKHVDRILNLKYPVWRCKVCGYLCAREKPPEICPVCKAGRERFEIFIEK